MDGNPKKAKQNFDKLLCKTSLSFMCFISLTYSIYFIYFMLDVSIVYCPINFLSFPSVSLRLLLLLIFALFSSVKNTRANFFFFLIPDSSHATSPGCSPSFHTSFRFLIFDFNQKALNDLPTQPTHALLSVIIFVRSCLF